MFLNEIPNKDELAQRSAAFVESCQDKTIAVVGNASSLIGKGLEIDSYDVIIRFNNGRPTDQQCIHRGSKTTHWANGSNRTRSATWKDSGARCIFCWINADLPEDAIPMTLPETFELRKILYNHYPSTGCMVIHMLSPLPLNLYGFDFCRTHNWFDPVHERRRIEKHNFVIEEGYITSLTNVKIH